MILCYCFVYFTFLISNTFYFYFPSLSFFIPVGSTADTVTVTCESGYTGVGTATCGTSETFYGDYFRTTAAVSLDQNTGDSMFGGSVAISSEFAIVGARNRNEAFIFKNTGGTWGTTAAFNLDQNTGDSTFGTSVAISSEFAIVGASNAKKAFIFENTGGTWGTTAAFVLDKNTGYGNFGSSVAISSNSEFAIVGAYAAKKAFIFKNTDGTWETTAAFTLDKNTGNNGFGYSVAISSEFAIVGAWKFGATKKAFIFKNTGGTWGTTAAFTLDKNTGNNGFGYSVAISSEFAIVGAHLSNKAFIFKKTGDTWGTTAAFTLDKNTGDGKFGISVAISSEFAIVGADGPNNEANKAFIFKNTGGTWGTTAAFNLDQNTGDDGFGNSVAISSEFAIVGAHGATKKAFIFKNAMSCDANSCTATEVPNSNKATPDSITGTLNKYRKRCFFVLLF
jgi:hypothetical protein